MNILDLEQDSVLEKESSNMTRLPRIAIIGVGGGGSNAVNNIIRTKATENLINKNDNGENIIGGVEFFCANTDNQSLLTALCAPENKIQLGIKTSQGLGAGAVPEVGLKSAEESLNDVVEKIGEADMVFIVAGMGGGTGTGAAPAIAKAIKKMGILTVGVVTKPFNFEGLHRRKVAEQGIIEMHNSANTVLTIYNQHLFKISGEKTTFQDAFSKADELVSSGIKCMSDLITKPGLINLDLADIRTIMKDGGKALMGIGEAEGDNRAIIAAEAAISNPLLENEISVRGAAGVIINISGNDMTLFEVDAAANRIREEIGTDEVNIIFGSVYDDSLKGKIRVSVIATGIKKNGDECKEGNNLYPNNQRNQDENDEFEQKKSQYKKQSAGVNNDKHEEKGYGKKLLKNVSSFLKKRKK